MEVFKQQFNSEVDESYSRVMDRCKLMDFIELESTVLVILSSSGSAESSAKLRRVQFKHDQLKYSACLIMEHSYGGRSVRS